MSITQSTRAATPALITRTETEPGTESGTLARAGRRAPDLIPGNSVIEVWRTPTGATVDVFGPLTSSCLAQLGEVMDWIVAIGVPRCRVHLATNQGIDFALLHLLRAARTRLAGSLIVTANSPGSQTPLVMVGLSDPKPARR